MLTLTMTIPTNLDNQVILDFPEIPAFVSIGTMISGSLPQRIQISLC